MSLKVFNDWVEEIQFAEVRPLLLAGVTFSATRHRCRACHRRFFMTLFVCCLESFGLPGDDIDDIPRPGCAVSLSWRRQLAEKIRLGIKKLQILTDLSRSHR